MSYNDYVSINQELTVTLVAYTAADVVGGLITFTIGSGPRRGVIRQLQLIDEDNQKEAYTLYLFDALPSTIANDAAFAPTIADLRLLVGTVAIAAASYVTVNSLAYIVVGSIDLEFYTPTGTLYGYLVATDTPDYANVDALYLKLAVEYQT